MQSGWRIGYLFGIPLYIDSSWFIILALLTFANGSEWQTNYPEWGTGLAWMAGLIMALLLFASVLLHELGHSMIAKAQGIQVNSITLFLFGGIASIDRESKTPGQAFQVAVAGPAVSFFLFALLSLISHVLPDASPANVIAKDLAGINLVLGLFNLIPGLPLDGGQILKAAVWKATNNRFAGVHWAARTGQTLGWFAILTGMTAFLFWGQQGIGGIWIALLGWFAVRNANAYDRLTDLQEALLQVSAGDAMTREFRVVDADLTLRQFADEYLLSELHTPEKPYYAASDGRYRGLVMIDDIRFIERSLWEKQTLHNIIRRLDDLIVVEEQTCLMDVINQLETHQLPRITVLSKAGAIAGVVDRGDIVAAISNKLKLLIPEVEIQRIKTEGRYPATLQLAAIAKATADVAAK